MIVFKETGRPILSYSGIGKLAGLHCISKRLGLPMAQPKAQGNIYPGESNSAPKGLLFLHYQSQWHKSEHPRTDTRCPGMGQDLVQVPDSDLTPPPCLLTPGNVLLAPTMECLSPIFSLPSNAPLIPTLAKLSWHKLTLSGAHFGT